jgi:hypothetical protein
VGVRGVWEAGALGKAGGEMSKMIRHTAWLWARWFVSQMVAGRVIWVLGCAVNVVAIYRGVGEENHRYFVFLRPVDDPNEPGNYLDAIGEIARLVARFPYVAVNECSIEDVRSEEDAMKIMAESEYYNQTLAMWNADKPLRWEPRLVSGGIE